MIVYSLYTRRRNFLIDLIYTKASTCVISCSLVGRKVSSREESIGRALWRPKPEPVYSKQTGFGVVAMFFRLVEGSAVARDPGQNMNFPQFEPSHPQKSGGPGTR